MQFLCPVINIHQKHIVKKEILEKVITVIPLLIGNNQMLKLADRNPADHIGILAATLGIQNKKHLFIIQNLKKMVHPNHLTVGRRIHKSRNQRRGNIVCLKGCRDLLSLWIPHRKGNLGNRRKFLYTRLNNLT